MSKPGQDFSTPAEGSYVHMLDVVRFSHEYIQGCPDTFEKTNLRKPFLNYNPANPVFKYNNIANYCIYNQPYTKYQPIKKTPLKDTYSFVYSQGKIKANTPNQSSKMEYAAYARRFGTTAVIGHS